MFRKPKKDEDVRKYKESMKWSNNQPLNNQIQPVQANKPSRTTTTNIETFETKLNPYGFIYIPKNALPKLPFKAGDKLLLRIDKTNGYVLITPANWKTTFNS